MKMSFFFGNVFWGVLLLLWGLSLILKGFHIVDLPLVKIFFAVVIIMFGIRILVGWPHHDHYKSNGIHGRIVNSGGTEYSTVFASQTIDLTDLKPDSQPLEINVVFGNAYVILPDDISFEIQPTSVFGSTQVPTKPAPAMNKPLGTVKIDATAVFGKLEFEYKPARRSPYNGSGAPADSTQGAKPDSL
jgi:hypothetical protein